MIDLNTTDYDRALLKACKKYIQITDMTEEKFIKELSDLAIQHIDYVFTDMTSEESVPG